MKPVMAAAVTTEATDEQLVAAARGGSDEAFEALFRRYGGRITGYVRGIVNDEGRAEDIVQETFISALRSLRSNDQAIIFKPWIYRIAHNACVDQLRRQKRAEEVSIDSEDLNTHDQGRLAEGAPGTESFVSQRDDLDKIKQAFGGLPESQHAVLILRELEGLSYDEIGQRLNLSRPAVESMLFRARRGLKHEYDEIVTGERCRRMQSIMAKVVEGVGSLRERRGLVRHLGDCTLCRREAMVMGLGGLAVAAQGQGRTRSALRRVAALIPIPAFLRHRPAEAAQLGGATPGSRREGLIAYLHALGGAADGGAGFVQKAVAVLAAGALVGGGGLVAKKSGVDLPLASGSSQEQPAPESPRSPNAAGTAKPASKKSRQTSRRDAKRGAGGERGRGAGRSRERGADAARPNARSEAPAGSGSGDAAPALRGATEGVTRSLPGRSLPGRSLPDVKLPEAGGGNGTLPRIPNLTGPGTGTPSLPGVTGGGSIPSVTTPGASVPPVELPGGAKTPAVNAPPLQTPQLP